MKSSWPRFDRRPGAAAIAEPGRVDPLRTESSISQRGNSSTS